MTIRLIILVGIGGMIGALARYSISVIFISMNGFPYATLITNLIGCFLLTYLLNNKYLKQKLSADIRTSIGTGIIGSFTTFSTFSLETVHLWSDNILLALTYMMLSVCGGLFFCYIGYKLANNGQRHGTV